MSPRDAGVFSYGFETAQTGIPYAFYMKVMLISTTINQSCCSVAKDTSYLLSCWTLLNHSLSVTIITLTLTHLLRAFLGSLTGCGSASRTSSRTPPLPGHGPSRRRAPRPRPAPAGSRCYVCGSQAVHGTGVVTYCDGMM